MVIPDTTPTSITVIGVKQKRVMYNPDYNPIIAIMAYPADKIAFEKSVIGINFKS